MQLKWLPTELQLLLMINIIVWFCLIIVLIVKLIERLKEKREEDKKMKDYRDY